MSRNHGGKGTRIYGIWKDIRKRCNNPNAQNYKWYGGKGIRVDEVWNDFTVFRDWALANGYDDTLTIERDDSDFGYTPSNCRWIPFYDQNRNKKGNTWITINGETMIFLDWCRRLKVSHSNITRKAKVLKINIPEYLELMVNCPEKIENHPLRLTSSQSRANRFNNDEGFRKKCIYIANKNLSKALGLPLTDKQRNARMENAKRLNNQINLNTKYHFE